MFNKKIIASTLSILTTLAMMGGATFAFFSSQATSTNNTFATGTVNLTLDDDNETTPASTINASIGGSDLVPGASVSGFISMHNSGSLPITNVTVDGDETVASSPDLAGKLNITTAKIGSNQTCETDPVDVSGTLTGTLTTLNGGPFTLPSSGLTPSQTKYLCLTFTLDSSTDNTYQGKSITETFTFVGNQ